MESPNLILNLSAVSLSEDSGLVRIPLLKLGKWVKGALKFAITLADVKAMAENFRKRANGEVVIDYEHATESPDTAKGQPIPAAGWLREIEKEPDGNGIVWGKAGFTQRARQMIAAGEYKYISPSITWGARDKVLGEQQGATLTSVALLNRPFFDMLPAIQLSEEGWAEAGGGTNMAGETSLFESYEKLNKHFCDLAHEREAAKRISFRQALSEIESECPALVRLREAVFRKYSVRAPTH